MAKISVPSGNDFLPQPMFLYGTKQEDGTPNFGLFNWLSYLWFDDLGVMVCLGGEKRTKDLIRKNGMFSVNLVTEALLPLADYYGNTSGYDASKMNRFPTVEWGKVLEVPTIAESPVSLELEVEREIHLTPGNDVFFCYIRNVLWEESLADKDTPFIQRMLSVKPVFNAGEQRYCSLTGQDLGHWGEPRARLS